MAKKSDVNKALSAAHLKAIGSVAASWASLEFMMLIMISRVSKIEMLDVITLAGPSNLSVWIDSISKFTSRSEEHNGKEDDLTNIFNKIKALQTKRNAIVHATWLQETYISNGILGLGAEHPVIVNAGSRVKGFGLPKRGKKSVIEVKYTAAEMRAVAKEIAKYEQALIAWLVKPNPAKHRNMLAAAIREHANTRQTNPKQKAPRKPSQG